MAEKKKTKQSAQSKATNAKKPTAARRIEGLEQALGAIDQSMGMLFNELQRISQVVQGLAIRLNAVIEAGEGGTISSDSVQKVIVAQNVKDLENKVNELVLQDVFKLSEEGIGERTFVVGRELTQEGKEANPRAQFAFDSLSDEKLKEQLKGKKAGDIVKFEAENALDFEILEVYAVQDLPEKDINFEEEAPSEELGEVGEEE